MAGSKPKSIAVLGGGLTGLAAAFRLTQQGHLVRLFESSPAIGGAIRTEATDGWLVESGPNSLQEGSPELAILLRELDLGAERIEASPQARNRYLVRGGRPMALPRSPAGFAASSLFSLGAKARIVAELLTPPWERPGDVSLADLVREHFGTEVLDFAVQPAISGIYAGDPSRLSAREAFPSLWAMQRTHGSLLRGAIAAARARKARGASAKIISFRRGLQTLPQAIADHLPPRTIVLNSAVEGLLPGPRWQVVLRSATEPVEPFDAVICALPAGPASRLAFGPSAERPLASLAAIEHPPVSSLFLGFRRDQASHPLDGFGMLVPAVEKRNFLGVLFSSSLFPGRAPAGHVALTVLVGGMLQPEIARLPTPALLAQVLPDLKDLLAVSGDPVFLRHHFWPHAIPQYHLGHDRHRETMAACERAYPGFYLGGQARDGISLPHCVASGWNLAERAS